MKVLLIDVYHYKKGGVESVSFNSRDLLKSRGHEVAFFSLKWKKNIPTSNAKYFPESKESRKGPFKQIKNFINYFYHFEAARKMEELIQAEHPDIAHIHLMWGQITPSILPVLKRHHIPIIYTVHDYRIVCPAYTFRDGKGEICEACKGKYFYRCFTHTCCKGSKLMSAAMAAEMYFRNIFFNPSKYINGFIYVSNFAKKKQELYMPEVKKIPHITLYNCSMSIAPIPKHMPENRYYLFFGRLSYEKGIHTLLEAFRSLPDCKLKVAGTGPKEEELKIYVKDHKMQNVEFTGYKSGQELTNLVSHAYFVIVPSEWYENNPMSIIESYAVGTPVIGANIGGIPEIIEEGKTGYQFKSGDFKDLQNKIVKANELTEIEYQGLSTHAISFTKSNFSVDKYYRRLTSFYDDVIALYNK